MLLPMLAYVRLEFPQAVKYPCIPVNVDGIPIYPRTSEGLDGVYACAPELYLALRLGAKIFVERGFFLNCLFGKDSGETSYSLCAAVRQLVADRANSAGRNPETAAKQFPHLEQAPSFLLLCGSRDLLYARNLYMQNVLAENGFQSRLAVIEDGRHSWECFAEGVKRLTALWNCR